MRRRVPPRALAPLIALSASVASADPFQQSIRPLLKDYCITCHSTEKQKGDLDLEQFTSLDPVKSDPVVWEHSLEQMKMLTNWTQTTLDQIAFARSDQHKLDEYLDSVRNVEKRIANASQRGELQGWRPTLDRCQLFLSMMDKMEVRPKTFGDAASPLEEV